MARPNVSKDKVNTYARARQDGSNIKDASAIAGFSYSTGRRIEAEIRQTEALHQTRPKQRVRLEWAPHAIPRHELSNVARDCLEDFGRFRARFLGRLSSPWQEVAGQQVLDLLESPFKEFVVLNCPPGSGKTTLFTCDIPLWLTARNRTIRGLVGAATQNIAERYLRRMREAFGMNIPLEADELELARGLALDAESVLGHDYGAFRPDRSAQIPWSNHQFTVLQEGETYTGQKEATWTAFGRNSEVISHRVNIMVWDDLVTRDRIRNLDMVQQDVEWWHDVAERRLEPYGLLLLQGQRLGANDLYKHCIDLTVSDVDWDEWDEDDARLNELTIGPEPDETLRPKYHHIVYKAHYNEHCRANEDRRWHSKRAPAYDPRNPEASGCLLDPVRLSWRELSAEKDREGSTFEVVYQQNDVNPKDVLVPAIWINGGTDENGIEYPGCWDDNRNPGVIPKNLTGTKLSIITVDPSPTKFWSIQWWYYVEPPGADRLMGQRYLIDMFRGKMDGPGLLDYNTRLGGYTGLLHDWIERGKKLGAPIQYLIVEKNGAQRFLSQYSWFTTWCSMNSVSLRPHNTGTNKLDEEFGVETIKHHYKFGRVSLPGTLIGRQLMRPLVKELTHYPDVTTTDCVMANWFMDFNLQHLVADVDEIPSLYDDMPGWLNRSTTYA